MSKVNGKTPKDIKEGIVDYNTNSLKFLIESGMERASLVLNAQAITDKLQNMAESLAKIEAADVMPIMDSMKENFGVEVAQRFEQVVSDKLRELTESLRTARDAIGNEILRMEQSVNGDSSSDMGSDNPDMGGDASNDMGSIDGSADDTDQASADAPADGEGASIDGSMPADGEADQEAAHQDDGAEHSDEVPNHEADAAFDDLFKKSGGPAGRPRRESKEYKGSALSETVVSDNAIRRKLVEFVKVKGLDIKEAVTAVSRFYQIDRDDVIAVAKTRKAK
jgi:hypothetical protein